MPVRPILLNWRVGQPPKNYHPGFYKVQQVLYGPQKPIIMLNIVTSLGGLNKTGGCLKNLLLENPFWWQVPVIAAAGTAAVVVVFVHYYAARTHIFFFAAMNSLYYY